MILPQPGATPRPAARRSRSHDGPVSPGVRLPALVLYPVIDPGIAKRDEGTGSSGSLRNFARIEVIALRTVRRRRWDVRAELDVQAADRRAFDTVVTVRSDVAAHEKYSLPGSATADRNVAGGDDHALAGGGKGEVRLVDANDRIKSCVGELGSSWPRPARYDNCRSKLAARDNGRPVDVHRVGSDRIDRWVTDRRAGLTGVAWIDRDHDARDGIGGAADVDSADRS